MKKLKFTFLFTLIFSSLIQSQGVSIVDSLQNTLKNTKNKTQIVTLKNKLSQEYSRIDPEQGKTFAKEALRTATEIDYQKGIAESYRCIGLNTTDSTSINFYNKGLSIAKKINDDDVLSVIYRNIAVYYIYRNDYKNGLDYSFKSLEISEKLGKNEEIAGTYINIGFVYNDLKDTKKALHYFEKALEKNKLFNNPTMKAVILENIGVIYNNKGESKKALKYLDEALAINRKNKNLSFIATNLGTLANIHVELKNNELAENYTKEALKISRSLNINRIISYNLQNLATIYNDKYFNKNNASTYKNKTIIDSSLLMLKQAVNYDLESNDIKSLATNYKLMAEIYEQQNDFKNAFETNKKYIIYQDSIYQSDTKETIKNLEDKRTIDLKNNEILLNKVKLDSKEKQKWYLIAGIFLLTIIGSLLFWQSKNRKKTNEKLLKLNSELDEANRIKTRFFSILNHDLRSPVANLVHFLHLKKNSPELLTEESKLKMEDKTTTSAENLLTSMEDLLLWSKGQMENFKPVLKNTAINTIFEDTKNHFSSVENIKINFENPENLSLNTDENYLKTIIRNLTNNAIKVLQSQNTGEITWKAWQENNKIYISISDNGKGAEKEQFKALFDEKEVVGIKTGLGLHLIRDLAKAIDCKIDVNSKINEGTTFTLAF
jgi:signal transduction histidine kinase/Tfp pilus assembly protein PilF